MLLNEWGCTELQESATVRPEVIDIVKQMSNAANVYMLAHVQDDIGEAVVTGALGLRVELLVL